MGERRAKCVHLIQYLAKQVENSSATGEQSWESHSTATNVSGVGRRRSGAGRGSQNKPSKRGIDLLLSECDLASLNRIYVLLCQRVGLHETEDSIFLGFIPLLLRYHLH